MTFNNYLSFSLLTKNYFSLAPLENVRPNNTAKQPNLVKSNFPKLPLRIIFLDQKIKVLSFFRKDQSHFEKIRPSTTNMKVNI